MPRRHTMRSEETGVEMPVLRYGESGPPLVYVPSSGGDETEFEAYGMHETCARWIEAGRVQVFSVRGFGPEGLFNDAIGPSERIARHAAFERYAVRELLGWIDSVAQNAYLGVVGASYGAFVAANLLFKHPERFKVACGLGGVYGMSHRLDGYHDDDVYFHTPLEYLPRLDDEAILAAIRATDGISLYGAENDFWLHSTHSLERVLEEKGLPHRTEVWPAPADHHQRWWRRQLARFLDRYY